MLSITTKTQYALLALLDLAEHYDKEIVQIVDIVKRNQIPKNYLEQILNRLTKTGIIKSTRGKHGGYELGRRPDLISIIEIIEIIEGKIELRNSNFCKALDEILLEIEKSATTLLNVSLSDLLERERAIKMSFTYVI